QFLAGALQVLDLLADGARFLFRIPGAGDGDLFAVDVLGAQGLAEPAFIMRDEIGGGGEDMAGRAVVALEADDFRAGRLVLEAGARGGVLCRLPARAGYGPTGRRARRGRCFGGEKRAGCAPPPLSSGGEGWGEGLPPRAQSAESPPHPARFARRRLPARGKRR